MPGTKSRCQAEPILIRYAKRSDLSCVDFRGANLQGVVFRAGTFWGAPDGTSMDRTRFDDTPAARRAIERGTASGKENIEWWKAAR